MYRGHQGHWELLDDVGCRGHFGDVKGVRGCRGVKGVLGSGRDCRYSWARKGYRGHQGHWELLDDVGGVGGHFGGIRGCEKV